MSASPSPGPGRPPKSRAVTIKLPRTNAAAIPLPPDRKEANRLAASRSRTRQAERAGVLESMAKGLAEENRELKERVDMLLGMGLQPMVKDEGGNENGLAPASDISTLRNIEPRDPLAVIRVPSDNPVAPHHRTLPLRAEEPPTIEQPPNPYSQTLNSRLIDHYTSQLSELESRAIRFDQAILGHGGSLPDLTGVFPDKANAPSATPGKNHASHTQTDELRQVLLSLQTGIQAGRNDVSALQAELAQLGGSLRSGRVVVVSAGKGTLAVNAVGGNGEATAEDESGGSGSSGSGIERCLGDLRRRVGQLLTHYDPAFVDPSQAYMPLAAQLALSTINPNLPGIDLPLALTLPPKFPMVPIPEVSRRGRPTQADEPTEGTMRARARRDALRAAEAEAAAAGKVFRPEPGKPGRPKGSKNRTSRVSRVSIAAQEIAEEMVAVGSAKRGRKRKLPMKSTRAPSERRGRAQGHPPLNYEEGSADEEDTLSSLEDDEELDDQAAGSSKAIHTAEPAQEASGPGADVALPRTVSHENDFAGLYAAQEKQAGQSAAAAAAIAAAATRTVDDARSEASPSPATAAREDTRAGSSDKDASQSTPDGRSRSSGKTARYSKRRPKPEPPRRYRIPGDDETIYVEQTVSKPDGTEEVNVTTVPVHTIRPYTGLGKKRGPKAKWVPEGQARTQDETVEGGPINAASGASWYGGYEEDMQLLLPEEDLEQQPQEDNERGFEHPAEGLERFPLDAGGNYAGQSDFGQLQSLVAAAEGEQYMPSAAIAE